MSFASAAALLVEASVKNRLRRLVKQPRNLLFLVVGAAYLSMVGGAHTLLGTRSHADPSRVPPWLAFGVLVYLAFVWLFGDDAAALAFTEAEVDFFFTAPVSRRQLIHYKLVRTLLACLASAAFFTVVLQRGGRPVFATIGFFLSFSSMAFHRVCAAMTRASLFEHGFAAVKRRLFTLAIAVAVCGAAAVSIARTAATLPSFPAGDPAAWVDLASAWAASRASGLSWVLFPVAAMVRVTSATTATQFFAALPAALAVLGVHYVWAISTDVAFEEASAEAAKKTARRLEDLRAGRGGVMPRTPPLFRLTADGAPWVAIFWKNLVAGTRIPRRQLVAWAIAFGAVPLAIGAASSRGSAGTIAPLVLAIAVFAAVLGPHMLQNDLRQDIDRMDLLRSYPMSPQAIVIGEVAAPLALLVALEWTALFLAAAVGGAHGSMEVCAIAVGCAPALPAVTACLLVLRNLGALWLPSWAGSSAQGIRGIEAFGQRLVVLFGTLVVLAFVLVPAGVVGGTVSYLLWPTLGYWSLPVAGTLGSGIALVEAYAGAALAGAVFERFDVGTS